MFKRRLKREMTTWQNDVIQKHYEEVAAAYRTMRGWKHDYHNHIQTMKAHLQLGQLDELDAYLGRLDEDLLRVDTLVKTGNVMVDAIVNSKLTLIREAHIPLNAKATVPPALSISDIDLCVILGNLLDNAMEACLRLPHPDDRFIRLYIGILKQQLYLSVQNAAPGQPKRLDGRYLSAKDSGSHGFGLLRVDALVRKCGGVINRQHEEGVFATEVMLPL